MYVFHFFFKLFSEYYWIFNFVFSDYHFVKWRILIFHFGTFSLEVNDFEHFDFGTNSLDCFV